MIVLNIATASHGLRPARDSRALSERRPHRIQTPTEVFPRNNLVDLRQRLVLGVQPGIPLRKIKKSHLTHERPSRCQQIVNPILNRRCAKMAFLEAPLCESCKLWVVHQFENGNLENQASLTNY